MTDIFPDLEKRPPKQREPLSIKKCSCCYHPPTTTYSEKFVKDNLDLFPEFSKQLEFLFPTKKE
jgi:hypothetical protein